MAHCTDCDISPVFVSRAMRQICCCFCHINVVCLYVCAKKEEEDVCAYVRVCVYWTSIKHTQAKVHFHDDVEPTCHANTVEMRTNTPTMYPFHEYEIAGSIPDEQNTNSIGDADVSVYTHGTWDVLRNKLVDYDHFASHSCELTRICGDRKKLIRSD